MKLDARKLAARLLLLSGVTHIAQLWFYPTAIIAAMFGGLYLLIGVRLLQPGRAALWFAATGPSIGGALGVYRFLYLEPNPFSVFHVCIDLVVVPACIWLLLRSDGR